MILAIETSCDDTCAAVVEPDGRRALSNVVHTQTEHARYGGVVPEVASRAHLERLDGVVQKSLSDAGVSLDEVSRVAVTTRPGLSRSADGDCVSTGSLDADTEIDAGIDVLVSSAAVTTTGVGAHQNIELASGPLTVAGVPLGVARNRSQGHGPDGAWTAFRGRVRPPWRPPRRGARTRGRRGPRGARSGNRVPATPADAPYGSSEAGSKYQGQRGPTASRFFEEFRDRP
jgi:hypothetical protein